MAVIYLNGTDVELQSKHYFDRIGSEQKKMPEFEDPGINNLRDFGESQYRHWNSSIIVDSPNFCNRNGYAMENSGYFIIPRCVTSDPRYKAAPMKYQKVLNILFEYVAFAPTTHAIGSEIIQIRKGQFCVSEAHLAKICNDGVKFEEDFLTKTIVHRAIQFWKKCKIVNQEVNRGKNIITITVPEFYVINKITSESESELQVNRPRITKEEVVEVVVPKKKEKTTTSTQDSCAGSPKQSSSSFEKLKELEERVDISEEDKLKLYEDYPIDRILAGIRSVNFSTAASAIAVLRSSIKNGWKPAKRKDSTEFFVPDFYLKLDKRLRELEVPISLNINESQAFINVEGYSSLEFNLSDPNFENDFVTNLTSLVKIYCPNQTQPKEM